MQAILSLDLTTQPAQLQVLQIGQGVFKVLESASVETGELFSRAALTTIKETSAPQAIAQTLPQNGQPSTSLPANEQQQEEHKLLSYDAASQSNEQISAATQLESFAQEALSQPLKSAISTLKNQWTSSVVILPPYDYLSFNLDLPFGQSKNLERIIDLDLQDKVPFDLSEFLVEYRPLKQLANGSYDVHVGIIPKIVIQNTLAACRAADIDPMVLTTPASAIEVLYDIDADKFAKDCAFVICRNPFYHLAFVVDGHVVADRIILRPDEGNQPADMQDHWLEGFAVQLEIAVALIDRRYQKKIKHIYVVDEPGSLNIQDRSGIRSVEKIKIQTSNGDASIASLAAHLAKDSAAPVALCNFRAREFSYNLRLGELLKGLQRLLPWLAGAITCFFLMLGGTYYFREKAIERMISSMHQTIRDVIPDIQFEDMEEAAAIQKRNFALEQELKDLGSPSKFSPLDILLELSRNFPASNDVAVKSLSIHGNQVKIEGTVENYSAIESVEKALKARKNLYCRVTKDIGSSSVGRSGAKGFTFELRLCE